MCFAKLKLLIDHLQKLTLTFFSSPSLFFSIGLFLFYYHSFDNLRGLFQEEKKHVQLEPIVCITQVYVSHALQEDLEIDGMNPHPPAQQYVRKDTIVISAHQYHELAVVHMSFVWRDHIHQLLSQVVIIQLETI